MPWEPLFMHLLSEKLPLSAFCFAAPVSMGKELFKMRNIRKLKVQFNDKPDRTVYFTAREVDCIVLLLEGKTYREIAEILGLSQRTVEFYVGNVKRKLNCQKKSELLRKILDSDFLELVGKWNEKIGE